MLVVLLPVLRSLPESLPVLRSLPFLAAGPAEALGVLALPPPSGKPAGVQAASGQPCWHCRLAGEGPFLAALQYPCRESPLSCNCLSTNVRSHVRRGV